MERHTDLRDIGDQGRRKPKNLEQRSIRDQYQIKITTEKKEIRLGKEQASVDVAHSKRFPQNAPICKAHTHL